MRLIFNPASFDRAVPTQISALVIEHRGGPICAALTTGRPIAWQVANGGNVGIAVAAEDGGSWLCVRRIGRVGCGVCVPTPFERVFGCHRIQMGVDALYAITKSQ